MTSGRLEHVNMTVADPRRSAALMHDLFGWNIRWQGPSMMGGKTIHVGSDDDYLALYTSDTVDKDTHFAKGQPMNHIGVVVDDLDAVEAKVAAAGLEPYAREKYDPGERFYFFDWNGIEFEVVSYA
ncbi:MAG: VOC family protein [Sphingomonadaceae bacterium]|nr:VOC family protein [Sphingomonadaceae bacterium]